MPIPRRLSQRLVTFLARVSMMVSSALYAATILHAYRSYLYPQWEYLGFTFRTPTVVEIAIVFALVLAGSVVVPSRLNRPSCTILLFLFTIVYVPGIVSLFVVDTDRFPRYVPVAVALFAAFAIAGATSKPPPDGMHRNGPQPESHAPALQGSLIIFGISWVIVTIALIVEYRGIMAFAPIDDVYIQREIGQSRSVWTAYALTYYGSVINPALLAIGLVKRSMAVVIAGLIGLLILYMINAQKTALLLPAIIFFYYLILNSRTDVLRFSAFPILVLSALSLYSVAQWQSDVVAGVLALFLVQRTIGTPGLTLSQYFEQFQTEGFTYWSHVKVLDWFIPVPPAYIGDPNWPGLGYMLGDRLFRMPEFNMNANLFAGDGIAALGAMGVLVTGCVLSLYLLVFDRVTRYCDQRFAQLAALPVAIALTNGHFFTTLLSFGGIFWILYFMAINRHAKPGMTANVDAFISRAVTR
jgi:hypothetical protein